jgi:hypothetical protein
MRRLSFISTCLVLWAAALQAAPRIEVGGLADSPFLGSKSVAVLDDWVYLVGDNQDNEPGLAVYHHPAEQELPAFLAGLSHRELGLARIFGVAASPGDRRLYLVGQTGEYETRILVFVLQPDGELVRIENFAATSFEPGETTWQVAIGPNGRQLYLASERRIAVYDCFGGDGSLALRQNLDEAHNNRILLSRDGGVLYSAGGFAAPLRSFLRNGEDGSLTRVAASLGSLPEGARVGTGWELAESPDGRFLYLAGEDDLEDNGVFSFARLAGGLLATGRRGPAYSGAFAMRLAVHPANGTLYVGVHDYQQEADRIETFVPLADGSFPPAANAATAPWPPHYESYPLVLHSVSGDRLYVGSFGGLALEPLGITGEAGALTRIVTPGPVGNSGFAETRDFAISPKGDRLLLAAPAAGRFAEIEWNGNLVFEGSAPVDGHVPVAIERLVFVNENRVAALVSRPGGRQLQLFDLSNHRLVARGPAIAAGFSRDLWLSPDGRQLFLAGEDGIRRTEYRASLGLLIDYGHLGEGGGYGPVRFSPDGRQVLVVANKRAPVIPLYHTRIYGFDRATFALTAEPDDPDLEAAALDYAFSPDGRDLYVLKNGPDLDDLRVQVRRRGPSGAWNVVQQLPLTSAATRVERPAQMLLDSSGRRLAILGAADGKLFHFDRIPADGSLVQVAATPAAFTVPRSVDADTAGKIAFGPGGNELWLLDPGKSRISVSRWGCDPAQRGELCLGEDGRFRAEVDWQTAAGRGPGARVVAPATDSGLFYFFDPDNWEMLVKVLDGCASNDRFWVFAAATTDVGYSLRVVDTLSGRAKTYRNTLGTASPAITDSDALAVCPPPAERPPAPPAPPPPAGAFGGDPNTLLLQGRFEVEVEWSHGDQRGPARVVPFGSADSGLFYFFSENNWEMLVKVLDGCAINQHYWVLAAATTDVGFRLEVRDLAAGGAPRVYSHPEGTAAPAIVDSQALGGCPSGGR